MNPHYKNLLIIAGTGRNSGKTTLACKIIERFSDKKITAVKISPHFHAGTSGPGLVKKHPKFSIHIERDSSSNKDSARMLRAGASVVYYVEVHDAGLNDAFSALMQLIPPSAPLIVESPALRKIVVPGVFLVVDHPATLPKKEDVLKMKGEADAFIDTSSKGFERVLKHLALQDGGWSYHS